MSSNKPAKGKRDGPSKDRDPGNAHSGEGLASLRPRLAEALADSERLSADRQADAMITRVPPEPVPDPQADDSSQP